MDGDHLPQHVRVLRQAGVLAEPAATLIQTHISYVLLTPDRAYKLKKPVDFGFLNYTSLEQRRAACLAEVELNRRLTEGVYLGVAPVTREGDRYRIDGAGAIVDWSVVMRRLPEQRMMDRLVERDGVTPAMLTSLARHLADFYASAPGGGAIDRFAQPDALLANWHENFAQTLPFTGRTIGVQAYLRIIHAVYADLVRLRPLWLRRIAEGRARDGHGDLRCSAVCFEDGTIQVYDCIEFNERFRSGDVAADVAFLAMDLDGHGRSDLAGEFIAAFVAASGDTTLSAVLPFYQCYRAYVRGKVDSFQLDEPEVPPRQQRAARAAARRRFTLARWYARRRPLTLAVVTGPDAGRRNAIAAALAARLGAVLLAGDDVQADEPHIWLRQRISVVRSVQAETGESANVTGHRARLVGVACDGGAAVAGGLTLPAGLPLRRSLHELQRWLGDLPAAAERRDRR